MKNEVTIIKEWNIPIPPDAETEGWTEDDIINYAVEESNFRFPDTTDYF